MSSPNQVPKIIHFPGGTGQRRQANYLIVAGPSEAGGIVLDTKIVFIADRNDPAKFDPSWKDIFLSTDSIIPNYLVNKVLDQELSGCRLDFIKVFFVTEPGVSSWREVYRWNFKVDCDNPIGDDPLRTTFRIYRSRWDWIKALFRIPGAVFETKGLTESLQYAGIYPVRVDTDKPILFEEERLVILQAVGLVERTL